MLKLECLLTAIATVNKLDKKAQCLVDKHVDVIKSDLGISGVTTNIKIALKVTDGATVGTFGQCRPSFLVKGPLQEIESINDSTILLFPHCMILSFLNGQSFSSQVINTLAHELRHVKQSSERSGEFLLLDKINPEMSLPYWDRPTEIDARKYASEYLKEIGRRDNTEIARIAVPFILPTIGLLIGYLINRKFGKKRTKKQWQMSIIMAFAPVLGQMIFKHLNNK